MQQMPAPQSLIGSLQPVQLNDFGWLDDDIRDWMR